MDDIPEAVREQVEQESASGFPLGLAFGGIFSVGAIALLTGFFIFRPTSELNQNTISPTIPTEGNPQAQNATSQTPEKASTPDAPSLTQEPPLAVNSSTKEDASEDNLLGHLPYEEVSTSELIPITADGKIRLRQAAAEKFQQMQADAAAAGVSLNPLSGFRSVDEQDYLFFRVKEQRVEAATKRAEVSAPPGYSEHHTGYALDIGDGKVLATNLSTEFENTAAFRWLEENAARYSFELSFPRDNLQGISYEPWHWRYVGDRNSLETFYKARNQKKLN
jgi:D-alanyl-D-alanine carboxypeptidase